MLSAATEMRVLRPILPMSRCHLYRLPIDGIAPPILRADTREHKRVNTLVDHGKFQFAFKGRG